MLPLLLIAGSVSAATLADRNKDAALLVKLEELRREYQTVQGTLQEVTRARWSARERSIDARADARERLDEQRQEAERLYADIARAREELLLREDALEGERSKLKERQDEWAFLAQAVDDKLEREQAAVTEGFPLDVESRLAEVARIGRRLDGVQRADVRMAALFALKRDNLRRDSRFGIARRTFVLESDTPVTAQVLRVGRVLAMGVGPDGGAFLLSSSGQLGKSAYSWDRVTNEELRSRLGQRVPEWLSARRVSGQLPLDIVQNRYSQSLTGQARAGWRARAWAFIVAGGPVMGPLGLVVIWAIVLVINRMIVLGARRSRSYHFINQAVELLGRGDKQGAGALAQHGSGVLARILSECLHHSRWSRQSAEKAMKELLMSEVPILDRHLDTLAVLAAAAPLLGLLGTVTGMIRLFEAITKFGTADPRMLSGGISEALVTTEVGLSIAIPLLLIHNALRNSRNHLLADMQVYAVRILNRLWPEE
jgi:biopolymer transport protein ExbB